MWSVKRRPPKKRDFSLSIWILISSLHHVCLAVLVSPLLPPSLLRASADPSCGFFCRGDAKYQPLPTGEAAAKYIPAWELDPIYPVSCTCGCTCGRFICATRVPRICTHTATSCDWLFSHLCAKGLFSATYHLTPLCRCNIHEEGEQPSPLSILEPRCEIRVCRLCRVAWHYNAADTKEKKKGKARGRCAEEMGQELNARDRWGEEQGRRRESEWGGRGGRMSGDGRAPGTPCP